MAGKMALLCNNLLHFLETFPGHVRHVHRSEQASREPRKVHPECNPSRSGELAVASASKHGSLGVSDGMDILSQKMCVIEITTVPLIEIVARPGSHLQCGSTRCYTAN